MNGLLSVVHSRINQSCIASHCRKDGCGVSLPQSAHNRLIIDCDKPGSSFGPNDTKCDYLLFEETRAVPIELKSGRIKASGVIGQLQAGASKVENLIPSGTAVQLQPLLACGSVPKGERTALNKGRVQFRGKEIRISTIRCGQPLPPA